MTGGAGAIPAAGMVERDAEIQRHVEQRLLLAVIFVGQLSILELHGLAFGQEGDLYCVFAGSVFGQRASSLCLFFSHTCSLILSARERRPRDSRRVAGATIQILLLPWDAGRSGLRPDRPRPCSCLSA